MERSVVEKGFYLYMLIFDVLEAIGKGIGIRKITIETLDLHLISLSQFFAKRNKLIGFVIDQ